MGQGSPRCKPVFISGFPVPCSHASCRCMTRHSIARAQLPVPRPPPLTLPLPIRAYPRNPRLISGSPCGNDAVAGLCALISSGEQAKCDTAGHGSPTCSPFVQFVPFVVNLWPRQPQPATHSFNSFHSWLISGHVSPNLLPIRSIRSIRG